MSDLDFLVGEFFLWGGLIFCGLMLSFNANILFGSFDDKGIDDNASAILLLTITVSGIGLCYFGVQAFG